MFVTITFKVVTWQPETNSSTSSGRKNVFKGDSLTTKSKPRRNALNCQKKNKKLKQHRCTFLLFTPIISALFYQIISLKTEKESFPKGCRNQHSVADMTVWLLAFSLTSLFSCNFIEKVTERLPGRGHGKTACVRRDSSLTSVLHFPFSFRVLT